VSDFMIEKGVEIPPNVSARSNYPFAAMEQGDSFFVPVPLEAKGKKPTQAELEAHDKALKNKRSSILGAARRYCNKFHTSKAPAFTSRVVEGGVRCWMTKDIGKEVVVEEADTSEPGVPQMDAD
jgi:hypothetical protein